MTLELGNTVEVINPNTIAHYQAGGHSTVGLLVRIDESNHVGHHQRPYFVRFPDTPGEWSFAANEIQVVSPMRMISARRASNLTDYDYFEQLLDLSNKLIQANPHLGSGATFDHHLELQNRVNHTLQT